MPLQWCPRNEGEMMDLSAYDFNDNMLSYLDNIKKEKDN